MHHQRQLLSSGTPSFVLDLPTLRKVAGLVQDAMKMFGRAVARLKAEQGARPGGSTGPPPGPFSGSSQAPSQGPSQSPALLQVPPARPPTAQEFVQQQSPPQNLQPLSNRPPSQAISTGAKEKQPPLSTANIARESYSSPAASASTPAPLPATPSHVQNSPQTPKSPKSKAPAKGKATATTKRRFSKVQPPPPAAEPTPPAESSAKRRREEEVPPQSDVAGPAADHAPSPKRQKTEWDGPPNEALVKKQKEVENIKTEEDAATFLEQMTELIQLANNGSDGESLNSQISETLDMVLRSMGSGSDMPDANGASSSSAGPPTELSTSGRKSPKPCIPDEFIEFFDFSSFGAPDDDTESKAETPELMPPSSTDHSPESGSETDAQPASNLQLSTTHTKTDNLKAESPVDALHDPLRMGIWSEIDGGESMYYNNTDGWKWEGQMPSQDSPWAIST